METVLVDVVIWFLLLVGGGILFIASYYEDKAVVWYINVCFGSAFSALQHDQNYKLLYPTADFLYSKIEVASNFALIATAIFIALYFSFRLYKAISLFVVEGREKKFETLGLKIRSWLYHLFWHLVIIGITGLTVVLVLFISFWYFLSLAINSTLFNVFSALIAEAGYILVLRFLIIRFRKHLVEMVHELYE